MIIGVAGGYVVSILTGAVNPDSYIVGVQYQFKPFYITYSLIKSSVFAFIITSISGFTAILPTATRSKSGGPVRRPSWSAVL